MSNVYSVCTHSALLVDIRLVIYYVLDFRLLSISLESGNMDKYILGFIFRFDKAKTPSIIPGNDLAFMVIKHSVIKFQQ